MPTANPRSDALVQKDPDGRMLFSEWLVASIADGLFTVDGDLVIRSFSAGMERLTGVAAGQAEGRPCSEVLRGTHCGRECPLRQTLERRAPVARCHEVFCPSGATLQVSLTTGVLCDGVGGDLAVGIVTGAAASPDGAAAELMPAEAVSLRRALEAHRWNASRAARALGISRTTIWRRMRRHGLLEASAASR